MKRATIILSFESLKNILGIPESMSIYNAFRFEEDLRNHSITVFVDGGNLPDIPEGTESPWYPLERLKEFE